MTEHDNQTTTTNNNRDWRSLHLWQIQPVRDVLMVAIVLGILLLGAKLSLVTVPVLLAVLLAYLFEPVVKRITSRGASRTIAAGSIIVGAFLIVIVPLGIAATYAATSGTSTVRSITKNVLKLEQAVRIAPDATSPDAWADEQHEAQRTARQTLPGAWEQAGRYIYEVRWLSENQALVTDALSKEANEPTQEEADAEPKDLPAGVWPTPKLRELSALELAFYDAYDSARTYVLDNQELLVKRGINIAGSAATGVIGLGVIGLQAFLTAFFFFFICTSWGNFLKFWESLLPEQRKGKAIDLIKQMDRVVAGFIRGRLTIMLIQSVIFMALYWFIGVPTPILLGALTGVLSVVPYLAIICQPIAIILMFLDPAGGFRSEWWWILISPIAVYQIGQMADDYFLTPKIQGKATGLDTPTVLFATIAGGLLAGIYGMLLAIPIAACIKILLTEVAWPKVRAWAKGRAKDPLPMDE